MSGIDYAIASIVAISIALGVWRGFVREAVSLVVWAGAFWIAYIGTDVIAPMLEGLIGDPAIRLGLAFVLLFVIVHVIGFFVSRLLAKVVKSIGLTNVDRAAGAGFGFMRGFVIVGAIVFLVGITPIRDSSQWRDSSMVPLVEDGLGWIQERYPLNLGNGLAKVTN